MDKEQEFLEGQKKWAKGTIVFFSNKSKPERDKIVVEAFLKICGVNYNETDVQRGQDPPDIIFRDARFEVTESMDDNRKRGDENKERLRQCENAKWIKELMEPSMSRPPITTSELYNKITKSLSNKANKKNYDFCKRQSLDVLVYVNLKEFAGYKPSDSLINIPHEWESQGWRSISFVMGWHAEVLFCNQTAPRFLQDLNNKGIILAENPLNIWKAEK